MQAVSLTVAIVLALGGYVITYINNLRLARRQERLALVNERLDRLYGPLYVTSQTAMTAYRTLLQRLGRPSVFNPSDPPTDEQLTEWRTWIDTVLMPIDVARERIIVDNAHLIIEAEIPDVLLDYLAWVYTYRSIVASGQPLESYVPETDYSQELLDYAKGSYDRLKTEQLELLGRKEAS